MATTNSTRQKNRQFVQQQAGKKRRENQDRNQEKDWRGESADVVSQYIECDTHPLLVELTSCYRKLEAGYFEGVRAMGNWSLRHGNLIERFSPENEGKIRTRQWDYAAACARAHCAIERISGAVVAMQTLLPAVAKMVKRESICLDNSEATIDNEHRAFDYVEHRVALVDITCAVELLKLAIDTLPRLKFSSPGHDVEFAFHQRCRSALHCFEAIPKMPTIKLKERRRNYWKYFCAFFGQIVSSAWSSFEGPDHPCFTMHNSSNTVDEQDAQVDVPMVLNKCKGWKAGMQRFEGRQDCDIEPGLEVKIPKPIRRAVQSRWWENRLCGW